MLGDHVFFGYGKDRPTVTGDGQRTTKALVDASIAAGRFNLTEEGWAALECDLGDVPSAGDEVALQWRHNLGTGAVPDLLDFSRPDLQDIIQLALQARKALGVRFAPLMSSRVITGSKFSRSTQA